MHILCSRQLYHAFASPLSLLTPEYRIDLLTDSCILLTPASYSSPIGAIRCLAARAPTHRLAYRHLE